MSLEMEPVTPDDVLADERLELTHFAQWVYEGKQNYLKEIGVDRVLATLLNSSQSEEVVALITPSRIQKNELSKNYVEYMRKYLKNFQAHGWEKPLLLFLKACDFNPMEIEDEVRKCINATSMPEDKMLQMKHSFDTAAQTVGLAPIFDFE